MQLQYYNVSEIGNFHTIYNYIFLHQAANIISLYKNLLQIVSAALFCRQLLNVYSNSLVRNSITDQLLNNMSITVFYLD